MSEARRQRWNERFSGEAYLFGTAPNAFLVAQRRFLRHGDSVLAIADGEGRNGVWLAEQGLEVLSVDFSEVALGKAQTLARQRGVSLRTQQADLFAWAWPAQAFDVVAAIFVQFASPAERGVLFARMQRALKPGGHLLLQGYRPEQLRYATGGPPDAENMYTEAMLRAAFAEMTILHLAAHDEIIQEGTGHSGMSALIDLVARK